MIQPDPSPERIALLLGLALFFGLGFEEMNAQGGPWRPGGIRTFPLLADLGALLFLVEPTYALAFCAGLLVLGACLIVYYQRHLGEKDAEGRPNVTLALPFCNLLAYTIGPTCLIAPPWLPVAVVVSTMALLIERQQLHRFAWKLPSAEIITAGKFLVLTGIVMPLLPDHPVVAFTSITPRQIWLAVVAICSLSYASYLLQRYVVKTGGGLWIAVLGGLYSSTATTVALARGAVGTPAQARLARTSIVLATAIMYPRLLAVIGVFNPALALKIGPILLGLCLAALALAWLLHRGGDGSGAAIQQDTPPPPRNPLEFNAAMVFAALYVAVSLVSSWVGGRYGSAGVQWLAAIVGFTDIDPFVLSLAQGGSGALSASTASTAILIAIASNNLLKAIYALVFAGVHASVGAAVALLGLAFAGLAVALLV